MSQLAMFPSEAEQILAGARARQDRRDAAYVRPDYEALNAMVKRQRAALTRAINSADQERIILACRDAVREWSQPGAMWPDQWADWQRALDDALPWNGRVDLRDLI